MKQNQQWLLLGAVAAAVAYYFYSKRNAAAAPARAGTGAGGAGFAAAPAATTTYVPVSPLPATTRYTGAPVPSLTTGLAIAGQNTLQQILQRLSGAGLNALGVGGGSSGNRGSGFGIGGGASPGGGNNNNRGTGNAPAPSPTPTTGTGTSYYPGQDQSSQYYTDPATGIVYDSQGNAVSGIPTDGGVPYQPDTSTITSMDVPTSVDTSQLDQSGGSDQIPSDFGYGAGADS